MADRELHSRGGRRSSVSEPQEFHWVASGGSLTLDHQPPTHLVRLAALKFLIRLTASRRRLRRVDTVACGLPLNYLAGSMLKYERFCT